MKRTENFINKFDERFDDYVNKGGLSTGLRLLEQLCEMILTQVREE